MITTPSRDAGVHPELTVLIPWYVNGTLGEEDSQQLAAHLIECARCREDLALERQIHSSVKQQLAVEYMPAASLKKLLAKIDGVAAAPMASPTVARLPKWRRPAFSWQGLTAASVAVMAVSIGLLAVDHFTEHHNSLAADIRTVTSNVPRPRDEVVRAVFAPNITLVELQSLLDEAQLRIISGPSEAGVYSLAATTARPVSTSLSLLRQHSSVRFAESTQLAAGSDRSP